MVRFASNSQRREGYHPKPDEVHHPPPGQAVEELSCAHHSQSTQSGGGMNPLCKDGLWLGIEALGPSAARLDLGATTITWKAPSMVFEPRFRLPFPYGYNSLFATSTLPSMISTSSKNNYIGHVYFFVSSYSTIWNVRDNLENTNVLSKLANSKFLVL